LRRFHRDDFIVGEAVDTERVTEALTAYSEFVGSAGWTRRVFVERVMKL
jgi:hypothetical protein